MKKIKYALSLCLIVSGLLLAATTKAQSISDLTEQLALDYQKLAGMKNILKQMYQGYEIIHKGYDAVSDVSKGNFNIHEAFLDGLYLVSPAVRKYPHVADIISDQSTLMTEYKSAYTSFRQNKHFTPDEISYLGDVYNNLISQSFQNLNSLSMVMTDSKLRMSDGERVSAVDRIYSDSHDQLIFLRKFNNQTYQIGQRRDNDDNDKQNLKNLYGIN
jgi:hypothetical protein